MTATLRPRGVDLTTTASLVKGYQMSVIEQVEQDYYQALREFRLNPKQSQRVKLRTSLLNFAQAAEIESGMTDDVAEKTALNVLASYLRENAEKVLWADAATIGMDQDPRPPKEKKPVSTSRVKTGDVTRELNRLTKDFFRWFNKV